MGYTTAVKNKKKYQGYFLCNNIQLLPALKVNIIIVHPRGVVFPEEKQHPKGEQL